MVATYLRQEIAVQLMIAEAERRLAIAAPDGTELYDGELAAALKSARSITNATPLHHPRSALADRRGGCPGGPVAGPTGIEKQD
jgi:hypothetical protein